MVKLRRIAPGYYVTKDGRFEVAQISEPIHGVKYWYWKPMDGDAHDYQLTKRDTLLALEDWLLHHAIHAH